MVYRPEDPQMLEMAGGDRSLPPEVTGALTSLDRSILGGKECRLTIPLVSLPDLYVVEEQLGLLRTQIAWLRTRGRGDPQRSALFAIQAEVTRANRVIREHFAPLYEELKIPAPNRGGRPRNDE